MFDQKPILNLTNTDLKINAFLMMENNDGSNPLNLGDSQPILWEESVLFPSSPAGEGHTCPDLLCPSGDRASGLAAHITIHPQFTGTAFQELAALEKLYACCKFVS